MHRGRDPVVDRAVLGKEADDVVVVSVIDE
jgi:hypothetical protein